MTRPPRTKGCRACNSRKGASWQRTPRSSVLLGEEGADGPGVLHRKWYPPALSLRKRTVRASGRVREGVGNARTPGAALSDSEGRQPWASSERVLPVRLLYANAANGPCPDPPPTTQHARDLPTIQPSAHTAPPITPRHAARASEPEPSSSPNRPTALAFNASQQWGGGSSRTCHGHATTRMLARSFVISAFRFSAKRGKPHETRVSLV